LPNLKVRRFLDAVAINGDGDRKLGSILRSTLGRILQIKSNKCQIKLINGIWFSCI
jgi:hypothetical protein